MHLKYSGRLGYLEARYRLNIGDRSVIMQKIEELKNDNNLRSKDNQGVTSQEAEQIFQN